MLGYNDTAKHFLVDGYPCSFTETEREELGRCHWYQSIPFGPEIKSLGLIDIVERIPKYWLNEIDFQGKSVLGIGCMEGFPLFYAEAKGAGRVVLIADDFGLRPSIDDSRRFAIRKLGSTLEVVRRRFLRDDLSDLGTFDIVLFFDSLPHLEHPMLGFEKAAALSHDVVVLTTTVTVDDAPAPVCGFVPTFAPHHETRCCSLPNHAWVHSAAWWQNLSIEKSKLWEWDFLSFLARKNKTERIPMGLTFAQLPEDHGLEEKTAVVVLSCERYREAWEPFFMLLRKYWPDCPYRIYLITDRGSFPGVESIEIGQRVGTDQWSTMLLQLLERVPAERIILFQEDFLLEHPVNTSEVRKLVRHSYDCDLACFRLVPYPPPTGSWYGCPDFGLIGAFDEFRFSMQLAIWRKDLLMQILSPGESPWVTEFTAARRSVFMARPFVGVWSGPISYRPTGIIGSEWQPFALELLKQEGFPIETLSKKL